MRVVVVGATGNVGTSLVSALSRDADVDSIVGIARRRPSWNLPKTEWVEADVVADDLVPSFRGADAVVHLAWAIQPSHDLALVRAVNVDGSESVFRAASNAEVPALVYASSIGAYSPGPKDRAVDESWPTAGIESSFYARHKAEVERLLDALENDDRRIRVVRLRPGLIFKGDAATEVRRLFIGPLLPRRLVQRRLIPIVPDVPRLRFQAVHTDDIAEAYRLAIKNPEARGAFNIAAEPVLDPQVLAKVLGARPVRTPAGLLRAAASLTWRLHLQPTPPGWLDLALAVPIMDISRARTELGWQPTRSSTEALEDLLEGLRSGEGFPTPPLEANGSGPLRAREFATGVGEKP